MNTSGTVEQGFKNQFDINNTANSEKIQKVRDCRNVHGVFLLCRSLHH